MMADINCKYYNSFIGNHKTVRFFRKKKMYINILFIFNARLARACAFYDLIKIRKTLFFIT